MADNTGQVREAGPHDVSQDHSAAAEEGKVDPGEHFRERGREGEDDQSDRVFADPEEYGDSGDRRDEDQNICRLYLRRPRLVSI